MWGRSIKDDSLYEGHYKIILGIVKHRSKEKVRIKKSQVGKKEK